MRRLRGCLVASDADIGFVQQQVHELIDEAAAGREVAQGRRVEIADLLAPRVERALAHARTLVGEAMDRGE